MLLCLAVSALTISSCQKEEQLIAENSPPSSIAVTQNQNDQEGDVCGAVMYSDSATQNRMAQMESTVQAYIAANPDMASGNSRTVVTIPVVFHVVYNTAEQNIPD